MILVDTSIVSTMAQVSALGLVRQLFGVERLYVTPAIVTEIEQAIDAGCEFLAATLEDIRQGDGFAVAKLDRKELATRARLPESLGDGEAEAIALCMHRKRTKLLSNDKRARNFCLEKKLLCFNLVDILRSLWLKAICSQSEVRELLARIEREGTVIKDKRLIFR